MSLSSNLEIQSNNLSEPRALCLLAACAPAKKGYTLKADTNWVKGSGTTESQTAPGAAEQKCNADPDCVAWNSFGYVISGKRDSVSYIPYKSLCVYVKDPPPGRCTGRIMGLVWYIVFLPCLAACQRRTTCEQRKSPGPDGYADFCAPTVPARWGINSRVLLDVVRGTVSCTRTL